MSFVITDGTGSGYGVKVDSKFRLNTLSTNIEQATQANNNGDAYNLNTGEITLTDAVDTPVLYVKNNEDTIMHITAIALGMNFDTGGSATEMARVTVVRNPTTGTIITSTPTAGDIESNSNFGSEKTKAIDFYKGATGDTMTDGTDHIILFQNPGNRLYAGLEILMPKGSSVGIKVAAPASSSSMDTYAAIICYWGE